MFKSLALAASALAFAASGGGAESATADNPAATPAGGAETAAPATTPIATGRPGLIATRQNTSRPMLSTASRT